MIMFFRTFIASLKKQLREFKRYPNFILKSFFYTPISIIFPYFFMMKTFIGDKSVQNSTELFALIVGIILWNFVYFSIIETCNIVSRELNIGTIEIIYITPASKVAWLLGSSFAPSIMFFFSLSFIVLLTFLILKPIISINIYLVIITTLLTIISTWAMCLLTFILNLWLKKVFNILNFSLDIVSIFVGTLYSVAQLPLMVRWISYLIPTTYSISLIRLGFTSNVVPQNAIFEVIVLLVITVILTVFSVTCYNLSERRLRKNGSFLKF